jgi:phage anti-repressor protein
MDQVIKIESINFNELVKASNAMALNDSLKSKMTEALNREFTDEEQRWYVANLYVYMHYHPTNDFPINLEHVYKMMGFSHKKNAKRTLENNFTKDEDYKISLLRTEKRKNDDEKVGPLTEGVLLPTEQNLGGRPDETIMLNIDTFKNLCMIVKTEKGKAIRKYYVKLENIYNRLIGEEMKEKEELLIQERENAAKLLLENEIQLKETKKQLEHKTKMAIKKWYNQEPGHTVYGYMNLNNNLVTIGKSKNIKHRESEYMTHNPDGEMFYVRKCYNCDLAEKVLHHLLDKYRVEKNREWFTISDKLAIYAIDTVCDFLDSFINCSEKLPEFKIKEFFSNLPIERFDYAVKLEKEFDFSNVSVVYNKNIKDYNKFIQDCCIIDDTKQSTTLTYDLRSAYKIWCKKCITHDVYTEFSNWIKENFEIKEKYFENDGIRHKTITNLRLKKFEFSANDKYNVKTYEKFCMESCVFDYSYKIKINDFLTNYIEWMQTQYPEYEITSEAISEIKDYFNNKLVLDNSMIYGIQLKTDELPNYRIRECSKIYVMNEDRENIGTFNGLSEAADILKLPIKNVSDIIRYAKVIEYNDHKVTLVYDKGENIIKTRNIEVPKIYKYDFDTKELLQTFNSTIEAAQHFEITTHTVLRYIAVEKIFSCQMDKDRKILLSYRDNITNLVIREKTKVIKTRQFKILYTYYSDSTNLFTKYDGPSDAAAKLKIGQCTVQRHIKSGKPLNILHNNERIAIVFTYTECATF